MPKVTDYELEHYDDEYVEHTQKFKKKSKNKEKKYSEKKDHRTEWKARKMIEESEDF